MLLPDPKITPGDALSNDAQVVCVRGYARRTRNVPVLSLPGTPRMHRTGMRWLNLGEVLSPFAVYSFLRSCNLSAGRARFQNWLWHSAIGFPQCSDKVWLSYRDATYAFS